MAPPHIPGQKKGMKPPATTSSSSLTGNSHFLGLSAQDAPGVTSVTSPAVLAPLTGVDGKAPRAQRFGGDIWEMIQISRLRRGQGHTSGTGRNIKAQETKREMLFYGPLCAVRVRCSLAINNKLLARDRVKIPAQSRAILTPFPSTSRWRQLS